MYQRIAIKWNETQDMVICAICGRLTVAQRGPEWFLADTSGIVCEVCARRHCYEMWAMLDIWRGRGPNVVSDLPLAYDTMTAMARGIATD